MIGASPTDAGEAPYRDVVVHIGYHKAASTLLQRQLFTASRGVYSEWPQSFYHRSILLARPDRTWARTTRSAFDPGIDEARRAGLRPVLSCEALSGDIWRLGQSNGYGNFAVADMLVEAFPGVTVVMVVREQVAMITSLFKHSLRSHWRYNLEAFLDQTPLSRGMAPLLNFSYLEYSWLVSAYHEAAGAERVGVVPFEALRKPADWADRWAKVLGFPVHPSWFDRRENPGMSAVGAQAKRHLNFAIPARAEPNSTRTAHLVNSAAAKIDRHLPSAWRSASDTRLRRQVVATVGDRFHDDNIRLAALTGDDWASYGYSTGAS